MNEDLRQIRINHAFVLHASIEDIEKILKFIQSDTDTRIVYERHSGNHLRIIEEKPGGAADDR